LKEDKLSIEFIQKNPTIIKPALPKTFTDLNSFKYDNNHFEILAQPPSNDKSSEKEKMNNIDTESEEELMKNSFKETVFIPQHLKPIPRYPNDEFEEAAKYYNRNVEYTVPAPIPSLNKVIDYYKKKS